MISHSIRIAFLCGSLSLLGFAQPGIEIPKIGYYSDARQSVRPLIGVAGNFIVGDSVGEGALSVASSGRFTMVKTPTSLAVLNGQGQLVAQIDAEDGLALFAFTPDGTPAVAVLPASGKLFVWAGDAVLSQADLSAVNGEILGVAANSPDSVRLLVARPDGSWIADVSATDGSLLAQTALPQVSQPAMLTPDGAIAFVSGTLLVVRDSAGNERPVDCGFVPGQLTWLGSGWLLAQDRDSGDRFAVRIAPGAERVLRIPEAAK